MTGKGAHGKSGEMLRVDSEIPVVAFGPSSFTPDTTRLYDENVTPADVSNARARSFWGDLAKKALKVAGDVATRPSRARAGTYQTYGSDGNVYTLYSGNGRNDNYTYAKEFIDSEPAHQSWLQKVTSKVGRYVFGAAVPEGEEEGTYVDENLFDKAGEYVKNYVKGAWKNAKEYATDFVEALLTDRHEYGHSIGIDDEPGAESYAVDAVKKLGKSSDAVSFALRNYDNWEVQPLGSAA